MSPALEAPVIEARGLTKRYGRAVAVDGIDLTVGKGEVFGLLGPNGSGKTTTILLLLGLTEPSAGEIRVLGLDPLRQPLAVKRRVGYLPDQIGFYDHLIAFNRHMAEVGFVRPAHQGIIVADDNLPGLLYKMASYQPHTPIFQMEASEL